MSELSYYFTLFKKFQVLGRVPYLPTGIGSHGAATASGGFDLTRPEAPLEESQTVLPNGKRRHWRIKPNDNAPGNSPLWALLNARAMGQTGSVTVPSTAPNAVPGDTEDWPSMPRAMGWAWNEFQLNRVGDGLVQRFGDWIGAGRINDIPKDANNLLSKKPGVWAGASAHPDPFVCSMPNDTGDRSALSADWWNTSLIHLIDPSSGKSVTPPALTAASEFYLGAVIGNRGVAGAGDAGRCRAALQSAGQGTKLVSKAVVMVWNTSFSPGVELPALSNLEPVSATPGAPKPNSQYEQYFLPGGSYDLVGFHLKVKTVYDGIVAACVAAGFTPPGSTSVTDWVLQASEGQHPPAHLCVKVVVTEEGTPYSLVDATPLTDIRIAQKNLMPFAMDVTASVNPNPPIFWRNFMSGQPAFLRLKSAGRNRLVLKAKAPKGALALYLAIPGTDFRRYFAGAKGAIKGWKVLSARELPYAEHPWPDAVVLRACGRGDTIEFGPLPELSYAGFALGIQFDRRKLSHGDTGSVTMVQETMLPRIDEQKRTFDIVRQTVGGFTLALHAFDARAEAKQMREGWGRPRR